ncbi:MAG: MBL fold metallo-hydrolase [Deltaproteobacteria bacterium]|nr:MBL fold metallo-hydrolase [Deltaproteobacteria bacterium]
MRIVILGSGTAIPLADRAAPALVLFAGGHPILLDFGPGTLRQLTRAGIAHPSIEHIFLTHFHPDHTAGLAHFFFATRNPHILPHRRPLTLAGPSGLVTFIRKLQEAYEGYLELPSEILKLIEFVPGEKQAFTCGDAKIFCSRTEHTSNSIAYRIEDNLGRSVVIAGDTGFSKEVIGLALGTDLLVLEASFPDGHDVPGHLTPSVAGRMATLARAKRLLLTHFYPECLEVDIAAQCRKTYRGELTLARDLLTIRI